MRRLLVTGASGWLAAALLRDLALEPLADFGEVRCLVLPGERLPLWLATGVVRLTIVEGRLEDEGSLERAIAGCGAVLHAAGVLHVRRTGEWYEVNTAGTQRLVAAARRAGVERFVFISSNAAAGRADRAGELLSEDRPEKPLSHYGNSKLLAEQAVKLFPSEAVILRPCMFYGPPVPARHVEVYRRILTGRMPLVGGGEQARSLTHLDNLVQACRLALTTRVPRGAVYFVADEEVYTTRRIIEAMAAALSCEPRWWRLPAAAAQTAWRGDRLLAALGLYWQTLHLLGEADWHVGVSIARAKAELGYQPVVGLEAGMRAAVAWCREQRSLPRTTPQATVAPVDPFRPGPGHAHPNLFQKTKARHKL